MASYFYLACDKCHVRTDAASKSGSLDEGRATHLGDSDRILPTFIVRHRGCGPLRVLSENDTSGFTEFEMLE